MEDRKPPFFVRCLGGIVAGIVRFKTCIHIILLALDIDTAVNIKMPDYSQAKIYKLTSTKTSICYIGSTTLTLKKRLSTHRSNYKQYKKGKALYKTSFEIIKKDPYAIRIKLLESYPCKNKFELQNREKSQIKKHPKCINHNLKNE